MIFFKAEPTRVAVPAPTQPAPVVAEPVVEDKSEDPVVGGDDLISKVNSSQRSSPQLDSFPLIFTHLKIEKLNFNKTVRVG